MAQQLKPYVSHVRYQITDEDGKDHVLLGLVTVSHPDKDEISLVLLSGNNFPNHNIHEGVNYLSGKVHGDVGEHGTWRFADGS